jgi:hypothetical protein
MRPSPITAEVSSTPRAPGRSATRSRILTQEAVHVGAEALPVERGGPRERFTYGFPRDHAAPLDRPELPHRDAVARHHEAFARSCSGRLEPFVSGSPKDLLVKRRQACFGVFGGRQAVGVGKADRVAVSESGCLDADRLVG